MKKSVFLSHLIEISEDNGITPLKAFELAKSLGFSAVDADYGILLPHANDLVKAGLKLANVYYFINFNIDGESKKLYSFFKSVYELGAKTVMLIPLTDGDDGFGYDKTISALKLACEIAKPYDITVTVEPFDFDTSYTRSFNELKGILDSVSDLKLTFDTGNFYYDGVDVNFAFNAFKDKIHHVHLKDRSEVSFHGTTKLFYTAKGVGHYPCPVLEGFLDIKGVTKKLLNAGYDGYFTAEHFCAGNQLEFLKTSAKNMDGLTSDN